MHPLETRLSERARLAGVALSEPLRSSLLAYYDLLQRWNSRINLTSLSDPDQAIDRLLLEPVIAAGHLPAGGLMDLGSGGGSPAIPLALAFSASGSPLPASGYQLPASGFPSLVMVESKGRKAAFLREAARGVGLTATVEAVRFEALAADPRYRGKFDVVSVRAVRMDEEALGCAREFVTPNGCLALFVSQGASISSPAGMRLARRVSLLPGSELLVLERDVPRETPAL